MKRRILQIGSLGVLAVLVLVLAVAVGTGNAAGAEGNYDLYLPFVTTPSRILFADDFSDPASGWVIEDRGVVQWSYRDDQYEIFIDENGRWAGALAPVGGFSTYSVQADMALYKGADSYYGLIFDFLDWDNYYFFVVHPGEGWYGLAKYTGGKAALLLPAIPSAGDQYGIGGE